MADDGTRAAGGERVLVTGTHDLATARDRARAFAVPLLGSRRADDVALVVSELVTNALEHGAGGTVEVLLGLGDDHELEVSVGSRSEALPMPRAQPASVHDVRGRGLPIVASLSDSVTISGEADSVRVVCRFSTTDRQTARP